MGDKLNQYKIGDCSTVQMVGRLRGGSIIYLKNLSNGEETFIHYTTDITISEAKLRL